MAWYRPRQIIIAENQAFGPHFAAQQPALGAQDAAAEQAPGLAAQDAAAQQPPCFTLDFFGFFGLAEQALHPLLAVGAHVAEAAVGATAIARPPATAIIVAKLTDFDIYKFLILKHDNYC